MVGALQFARQFVARLQRRWEKAADARTPVDLCRDLMRFTVDVTTQLAFGIDVNTIETDGPVIQQNLDKIFPMLNLRVNAPFPYWRYLRLPRDRLPAVKSPPPAWTSHRRPATVPSQFALSRWTNRAYAP